MVRKPKHFGRWIAIGVAIGLVCSSQALAKKPDKPPGGGNEAAPYVLVDLLGLPEGSSLQSDAQAVSQSDEAGGVFVAGNSRTAGEFHPVLWGVDGDGSFTEPLDLGAPTHPNDYREVSVNDAGVVVTGGGHVFVPGLGMQELPRLGGVSAGARAVNNLGLIVGGITFDDGTTRGTFGAMWVLADGVPGDPIILGGFWPYDISDTGVMAGNDMGLAAIAWLDAQGNLQVDYLGVLPGYDRAEAEAISTNGGWVAGHCRIIDGPWEAFVWSETTGMIGLGRFGGSISVAWGVNNAGQAVGYSDTGGGRSSQAAFLWQDGMMLDLNSLADTGGKNHLQLAKDINNAGHIVGLMCIWRPVSESHGFLLIPNGE